MVHWAPSVRSLLHAIIVTLPRLTMLHRAEPKLSGLSDGSGLPTPAVLSPSATSQSAILFLESVSNWPRRSDTAIPGLVRTMEPAPLEPGCYRVCGVTCSDPTF
jgi:hypothetical protein